MHVLATAGHVDHGKSTLVRALTGMEPDRWAEERRRGMTIDLGFVWTALGSGATVAFVDVPGHERFVTTMLAGVGPVPAVLFVVAADEGWMAQSTEHAEALTALGVRDGLLVVTRCDLMDPELALDDAREHLAGTSLAGIPHVCVSARTGAGMADLRAALEALVAALPPADPAADVRLWIDRAFTIRGAGTVVTGTLAAGRIRTGEQLDLLGADGTIRQVTVRALQSLGSSAEQVSGVARVAVNLRGISHQSVARGDALLRPGAWRATTVLDARLHPVGARPVDPAGLPAELTVHAGSVAATARVRPLGTDPGADTIRLQLRRPLPLRIGDRAVLRDPGRRRVAAGLTVLDVAPPPLRRRGAAVARARELARFDGLPRAADELARRGVVHRDDLVTMGVPATEIDAQVSAGTPAASGWLVDPARATAAASAVATAVAAHHAADPLDPGLPVEAARRAAGLPEVRLVDAVLRHAGRDDVALRDGRVVLCSAGAGLPAPILAALEALRAELRDNPFAAPDLTRLAALGLGPREIGVLARAGELLKLADGVVLLPGADARAVELLAALPAEFTLSEARQALGTTRRVAVPLLELLRRTGRAIRTPDGDHRLLRARPVTGSPAP